MVTNRSGKEIYVPGHLVDEAEERRERLRFRLAQVVVMLPEDRPDVPVLERDAQLGPVDPVLNGDLELRH